MTEPTPPTPRMNAATLAAYQHEERMAQIAKPGRVGDAKIGFSRNAKGETQISVEVAAPVGTITGELSEHARDVFDVALFQYEAACRRFPTASGTVTNDEAPKGEK